MAERVGAGNALSRNARGRDQRLASAKFKPEKGGWLDSSRLTDRCGSLAVPSLTVSLSWTVPSILRAGGRLREPSAFLRVELSAFLRVSAWGDTFGSPSPFGFCTGRARRPAVRVIPLLAQGVSRRNAVAFRHKDSCVSLGNVLRCTRAPGRCTGRTRNAGGNMTDAAYAAVRRDIARDEYDAAAHALADAVLRAYAAARADLPAEVRAAADAAAHARVIYHAAARAVPAVHA